MATLQQSKHTFGMIGLGTMGRNLLLNMAEHGFNVAGYDKDTSKVALLREEGASMPVTGYETLNDFIGSLSSPRAIMMLVPAGKIVDNVIDELVPLLNKGDILIDGGNSHFTDTNRRVDYLQDQGIHFFGMGISGGEEGARKGPSMMPGGDKVAYNVVKDVFDAIAAKVDGTPCVTYIGPGAAGHFVKMVHNGIEYAQMQLIAECYEFMRKSLGLSNDEMQKVFDRWNQGKLKSFLIEITKDIFAYREDGADHLLLDDIRDEARAKGTGKWTSQVAMDLEVPVPAIDIAVGMRDLSKYKVLRVEASNLYPDVASVLEGNKEEWLSQLENAYYFSMITTYAQGMHLLSKASTAFMYDLKLDEIAAIWRGGCIIRSEFLKNIMQAFRDDPSLPHLLMDSKVADLIKTSVPAARDIIASALKSGIAVPAFASCLSYFDTFRTASMPTNLIQAQRDFFGAHTYQLIGQEGVFHSQWLAKSTL